MNCYDGIHWNIYDILPYQRNFNLINSERSIGKTYTTQKFVLDKCIEKGCEFIYIVRTKTEKDKGVFADAYKKVIRNEFNNFSFEFTNENMFIEEGENKRLLGYCLALSDNVNTKKLSFPNVKYMIFDEYIVEESKGDRYFTGWKEPDALLRLYHTVDREEDRVILFMLANTIKFQNPYHLHPAFKIPKIEKGKIWTSENVLFQYAKASTELKEKKASSKFVRMIQGTEYGDYANGGIYSYDDYSMIAERTDFSKYVMTLEYNGKSYGVWSDIKIGLIFIDNKVDPSCIFRFALTVSDHKENTMLTRANTSTHLKWLSKNYKFGNVRYCTPEIKERLEQGLSLIL